MDKSSLSDVLAALTPAAVCKAEGIDTPTRGERVAARRIVAHAWCDIDAGRSCPAGSWSVRMSDGSVLPFRLWAEGVLGIRESGKAHAVAVV